jgi:predicted metallopeptidase
MFSLTFKEFSALRNVATVENKNVVVPKRFAGAVRPQFRCTSGWLTVRLYDVYVKMLESQRRFIARLLLYHYKRI